MGAGGREAENLGCPGLVTASGRRTGPPYAILSRLPQDSSRFTVNYEFNGTLKTPDSKGTNSHPFPTKQTALSRFLYLVSALLLLSSSGNVPTSPHIP